METDVGSEYPPYEEGDDVRVQQRPGRGVHPAAGTTTPPAELRPRLDRRGPGRPAEAVQGLPPGTPRQAEPAASDNPAGDSASPVGLDPAFRTVADAIAVGHLVGCAEPIRFALEAAARIVLAELVEENRALGERLTAALNQVEQSDEATRAVYRERAHFVALLARLWPAHKAADSDEPDWTVVCVHTPAGQAAWHISPDDLDLFDSLPTAPNDWDGHTTVEKYRRLAEVGTTVSTLVEMMEGTG